MKKLLLLALLILSSSVFAEEMDQDQIRKYEVYCMKFARIESGEMALTIKEMEASIYPIESYFEHSLCQPGAYSPAVKSPMLHKIADDPEKNGKKLETLWRYYSMKRKQPELFTKVVNVTNTEGQTLLDYIEYWTIKPGGYGKDEINQSVKTIVEMLCSHGAVYSFYPNSCPNL